MTNAITHWVTLLRGHRVGADALGNVYYQDKNAERRWVVYKGEVEATRVPPLYRGWLHKTLEAFPEEGPHYSWEKPLQPNPTGTSSARFPLRPVQDVSGERVWTPPSSQT